MWSTTSGRSCDSTGGRPAGPGSGLIFVVGSWNEIGHQNQMTASGSLKTKHEGFKLNEFCDCRVKLNKEYQFK